MAVVNKIRLLYSLWKNEDCIQHYYSVATIEDACFGLKQCIFCVHTSASIGKHD